VAPRRIDPGIPRELETILINAMAKEPASRYATARDLADDLRHFLEDKPIRAQRPTAWERLVKWARRHPELVASTLLVSTLDLIGSRHNHSLGRVASPPPQRGRQTRNPHHEPGLLVRWEASRGGLLEPDRAGLGPDDRPRTGRLPRP